MKFICSLLLFLTFESSVQAYQIRISQGETVLSETKEILDGLILKWAPITFHLSPEGSEKLGSSGRLIATTDRALYDRLTVGNTEKIPACAGSHEALVKSPDLTQSLLMVSTASEVILNVIGYYQTVDTIDTFSKIKFPELDLSQPLPDTLYFIFLSSVQNITERPKDEPTDLDQLCSAKIEGKFIAVLDSPAL